MSETHALTRTSPMGQPFGCSVKQWDDPRFLQRLAALLWQGQSVNASYVYARARRLMGIDD